MRQAFNSRFGWRLCGVLVLAILIFASLLLPPQLEQLRSGHWEIEHFLAYFMAACPSFVLVGPGRFWWPRPLQRRPLEALQSLRPDHSPNIIAALSSIGGVVVGALIAALTIRVIERQASRCRSLDPSAEPNDTVEG